MNKNQNIDVVIEKKYRDEVINCLKDKGATNEEIALLKNETIKNSIQRKRKPEDVAWAILQ